MTVKVKYLDLLQKKAVCNLLREGDVGEAGVLMKIDLHQLEKFEQKCKPKSPDTIVQETSRNFENKAFRIKFREEQIKGMLQSEI